MEYVQLFGPGQFSNVMDTLATRLASTAKTMAEHLQTWDPDAFLNAPVDDVIDRLVDMGSVACPHLRIEDKYLLEPTELNRTFSDFGRTYKRRVTRFVLVVPFDGEQAVFTVRADHSTTNPPQVLRLEDHELHLAIDDPPKDSAVVRARFDAEIAKIEQYLGWSRSQIEEHNKAIQENVPDMVARRRQELLDARNLQADIGYPIKRRADADKYSVPVKRKQVGPRPHPASAARAPFKPEPVMEQQDYESALRVLLNQRNAMERSPSVAADLKEEAIRDILLVGLNAQFEGAAGGEVFNGAGKTDILIRVDDRNIFIGECKIWRGPKTMADALDQLFSYLVWRDTKAAMLLFIRNADVSAVIKKAIEQIKGHDNHKHSPEYHKTDADQFQFTMHAKGDPEREIHLTLLPFAIRAAS